MRGHQVVALLTEAFPGAQIYEQPRKVAGRGSITPHLITLPDKRQFAVFIGTGLGQVSVLTLQSDLFSVAPYPNAEGALARCDSFECSDEWCQSGAEERDQERARVFVGMLKERYA